MVEAEQKKPFTNNYLKTVIILLILADVIYSFIQHLHMPLDGDMAGIILPSHAYQPLMHDPFGFGVLFHGEHYASPNRFFAHWMMSSYFKTVPFILQYFVSPLDSIYLSSALAKILLQLSLIWIFASYITGSKRLISFRFLLAALLVIPLFQTDGYNNNMGIIDKSITYTFFYALPLGLVLLFFLPFYRKYVLEKKERWGAFTYVMLGVLAVVFSFSGPLVPGVILVGCSLIFVNIFRNNYLKNRQYSFNKRILIAISSIPKEIAWVFLLLMIMNAYSLFIGFSSTENPHIPAPLIERYRLLGNGLLGMISSKLGQPLILLAIIFNTLLIKRFVNEKYPFMLRLIVWLGIFSFIYLLLLPFGGYREYRPSIVRRDTILPVILILVFLYGWSSYVLATLFTSRRKGWYFLFIASFLLFFTVNDNPDFTQNKCEKEAIVYIAGSEEDIVRLPYDCTVMSWHRMTDYKESGVRGQLLMNWHITDRMHYYFQP